MRVSRLLWLALVVALFCLPLFVGLGREDMRNDEAIYSYAVQSVIETGDWLNPRSSPNPNVVFLEKPPLKIWIVGLPIRLGLLPNDEFGLRFWDAAFGAAGFLYVFALGRRMAGPFCGFVAGLVLFAFTPLVFEHGLRSNNMEAPLFLSYCGGVYHYLRWAEETEGRTKRHALAVALYFFLGFMTKFVAALFLPLILAASSLLVPSTRARLVGGWRTWLAAGSLVVALVGPWFLYEWAHSGSDLWVIMFGEHVFRRFSTYVDPAHVQPWSYYFTFIFTQLAAVGVDRWAYGGGALMLLRVIRRRWADGTLILVWFALPLTLMSMGTSKLGHYSYPYLPPVALAAAYLMASVLHFVVDVVTGRPPEWLSRVASPIGATRGWIASRQFLSAARSKGSLLLSRHAGAAWAFLTGRLALAAVATVWLLFAIIAMLHPGRLEVGGVALARNPIPYKLAFRALVVGAIAGYAPVAARVALPVLLISYAPVEAYRANVEHLQFERHPLRTARECLLEVREEQRRSGHAPAGVYAFVPNDFLHPYFFYLRQTGWEWHDTLSEREFASMVDPAGNPRPILLSRDDYERLWQPYSRANVRSLERVPLDKVLLVLPGPFARCSPE